MSIFKRIKGDNHIVEPFQVHASQSFAWTSGSSNISGFSINLAKKPPSDYTYESSEYGLGGTTNGGFYSYPLYYSVQSYFYNKGEFEGAFGYYPTSDIFVINIGSNYYGDRIKPLTFKVEMAGVSNYISDDANGQLKLNSTGSVIGNVFYTHGIAVLKKGASGSAAIDTDGISISGSDIVTTSFRSTVDIYEHTVSCTIAPGEFRSTVNPSSFITGSSGSCYSDYINSGSVLPYITTIGLFNDFNELVAVAKLSKPIIRQKYTDQTFIVKFDE